MKTIQLVIFMMTSFLQVSVKAWDVDLSRRKSDLQKFRGPASVQAEQKDQAWVDSLFQASPVGQEIVILLTEKGFVPESIRLQKGQTYKIHVVNVNDKEKNTSFVLDSFSETHGTFFGQTKTFQISPKTDGIFSYVCPETAKQGRLIVYSNDSANGRKPASE